jgi:hypothetical protein
MSVVRFRRSIGSSTPMGFLVLSDCRRPISLNPDRLTRNDRPTLIPVTDVSKSGHVLATPAGSPESSSRCQPCLPLFALVGEPLPVALAPRSPTRALEPH